MAPENTLASFQAALEGGADGVEFDVQFSRDGVPMVIHDEYLGRTTGEDGNQPGAAPGKLVASMTCAQLQQLDAGSWFDPAFSQARIPTMDQVLDLLRPSNVLINIELKTLFIPGPGLVEAVVSAVGKAGVAERVVLSSFNHHTLQEAQAQAPHLQTGALFLARTVEPWNYVRQHGFNGLHPRYTHVDDALVAGCKEANIPMRIWTVNDEQEASRLIAMGVQGIITDDPRRMKTLTRP